MDIQLLGKLLNQLSAQSEQEQTNVNQALVGLHKANVQSTFQTISEKAHLNIPLPDCNPQHVPLPSDVHKAISANFPIPKKISCKEDLNDINYDIAPPFPPNYAAHIQSEILKSSAIPASSVPVFLDFICKNSMQTINQLNSQQESLLLRGETFGLINSIEIAYSELARHKNWHFELLTRVLGLCQYSQINIPESTLQQFFNLTTPKILPADLQNLPNLQIHCQKATPDVFSSNLHVQQVLAASNHFLSLDDLQRVFKSLRTTLHFSEVISISFDFLNYLKKSEIVQKAVEICTEKPHNAFAYAYDTEKILKIISSEAFQGEKVTENQKKLRQISQSESILDGLVLEMLEKVKQENLYGSDLNFEKFASKILQNAILLHQNIHQSIPSFASIGYASSNIVTANQIDVVDNKLPPSYISTSSQGIYVQKMNLINPEANAAEKCGNSIFTVNINSNKQGLNQDIPVLGAFTHQFNPPSTFPWKVSAKQADFSLSFIFGLLTGANPQNRLEAAKQFIENDTYKNIIFVKEMGYESAGYQQLVKSLHLIRFVRINEIYAEMIQEQSIISLILHKFKNQSTDKTNELLDKLVIDSIQDQYKDMDLSAIFQNSTEFRKFINFEQKYQELKQNKQPEVNYTFDDQFCYNQLGQKVVFQQAIDDVNIILLQDQNAIQSYYDRLITLGRRKFLEMLVFNEDYCKIKHESYQDRQKFIFALTNQELYDLLSAERKQTYAQFSVENLVDLFQITFDILLQELNLIKQKTKLVKYLYETSLFLDKSQHKIIENLILQISTQRPYNFENFSKIKTIKEETDTQPVDLSDISPQNYVLLNLEHLEHPVTQIELQAESLSMLAEITDTLIQTEFDLINTSKTNSTEIGNSPNFYDSKTENFIINGRNYDISHNFAQFHHIPEIIIKIFQSCTEIQTIFTSEAFPKIFQGVKDLKNQQQRQYQYEIYSVKQVQAIQFSVIQAALSLFITQFLRFKNQNSHCFPLPDNITHMTDPGMLLQPELLFTAIQKQISTFQTKEKTFSSILGLIPPPGGACTKEQKSSQTDSFSRVLNLRDLFFKADKSSRNQLSSLIKECNFELFEGFPAVLPLPFHLYAKLINFQFNFTQNCRALLQAHFLRLSEIKCVKICSAAQIDTEVISCFPRVKLGVGKYPYREILGYQSLTNNLPFLTTIDEKQFHYYTNFDTNSIRFFEDLLGSQDFSFDADFAENNTQQQTIYDVLMGANLESVADFPQFSTFLDGKCGIFSRQVFCEMIVNYLKMVNLRNNQMTTDYVLINEMINTGFKMSEIEEADEFSKVEYYDNMQFFDRIDVKTSSDNTFTQVLSSLYFNVSEDILANLAIQLNNEYVFRLKTYHPEEINIAITSTHRNQIVYNLSVLVASEAKKLAGQAQIRGVLNILRTQLYEVNQDESIFLLDSSPIYRGRKQVKNLLQQNFILNEDGFLTNIFVLPHPINLSLSNTSSVVLDAILVVLQCFESVVRHNVTRSIINGYTIFDAGKGITNNLEFLNDIFNIELDYDQNMDMDIIPEFLEGRDTSSLMKYNVRFKNVGYLSENELNQISLNVKKVQENVQYQKKQNIETTDELHEVTNGLEYSKTLLAVQKCIQIRDKNELVIISSLTQSLNICIRKGLFNHAYYLQNLLANLSVKYNFELLDYSSNIKLNSYDLYQETLQQTFIRCFQQQIQAPLNQLPAASNIEQHNSKQANPFEVERGSYEQQMPFTQLLSDKNINDEKIDPATEEEFVYSSLYSNYSPCSLHTIQYISVDPDIDTQLGQLVSLNDLQNMLSRVLVGCSKKGTKQRKTVSSHFQFKQYEHSHNYEIQPYALSSSKTFISQSFINVYQSHHNTKLEQSITTGFGLDGSLSPFNIFGITGEFFKFQSSQSLQPYFFDFTKAFEASLCSTLTQIELQGILASKGKSQWEPILAATQISLKHILFDRLERTILKLHNLHTSCKDSPILSTLSLLGQNSPLIFQKGFKERLETIQDDKTQQISVFVQSKTPSLRLAKSKEQQQFLLSPFFIFLEEKQLESIFLESQAVEIHQKTEFARSVFVEAMYSQLRSATYQKLSNYVEKYTNFIVNSLGNLDMSIYETYSSSDLPANYIKFMAFDNQKITDLLFLSCRERNLQPQIRDLTAALCGMMGLGSEMVAEIESVLANDFGGQEKGTEGGKQSQFKQQIQLHEFDPKNLIFVFLATMHAGFLPYCVHFIYTKIVRELVGFLKAPENQIHDIKYQQLQDNSEQFRSSDKGEFFKLKLFPVYFEKLIDVLNKFDLQQPLIQISTYNSFQSLKMNKYSSEVQTTTQTLTSSSKITIQQISAEIRNKSQALLNPLAINQMNQLSTLEQELYSSFEQFTLNESAFRDEIHTNFIQKLQAFFTNLIETNFNLLKLKHFSTSILSETLDERNVLNKELAGKIFEFSGIKSEKLDNQNIINVLEFTPNDDHQRIVENYQKSIRMTGNALNELKIQTIMYRNLSQYRLQILQLKLDQKELTAGLNITNSLQNLFENLNFSMLIDGELVSELARITSLMAAKKAEIQSVKREIQGQNPIKKRIGSASGTGRNPQNQIQNIIKNTLQQQLAQKTLPILQQTALNKSLKICSEGETLLLQCKQKQAEFGQLQQNLHQMEDALRVIKERSEVDKFQAAQLIQKELNLIQKAEKRCADLQIEIDQLKALSGEVLRAEVERQKRSGNEVSTRMQSEIKSVQNERKQWKNKREKLQVEYSELFKMLE